MGSSFLVPVRFLFASGLSVKFTIYVTQEMFVPLLRVCNTRKIVSLSIHSCINFVLMSVDVEVDDLLKAAGVSGS